MAEDASANVVSLREFLRRGALKETEEEIALKNESRCLLLVAHEEVQVLTWMAGEHMAEFIGADGGSEGEPFDASHLEVVDGTPPLEDGLYVGEFCRVFEGRDFESQCEEYALGLKGLRQATAVEWADYRRGEWPWEPLKASRFYETQSRSIKNGLSLEKVVRQLLLTLPKCGTYDSFGRICPRIALHGWAGGGVFLNMCCDEHSKVESAVAAPLEFPYAAAVREILKIFGDLL